MANRPVIFGSLTRITDLNRTEFAIEVVPRERWRFADFVLGEVVEGQGPYSVVELPTGRLMEVVPGDRVVGALATRAATLETCGDWSLIEEDLLMDQMSPAGLFGKETSRSYFLPQLPRYRYMGHITVGGRPVGMGSYAPQSKATALTLPVILITGTSMSAGKTATARAVIRILKELGWNVLGAKLTGAGRYRDILTMQDAGADHIYDFVDAGLPSTVCSQEVYFEAIRPLLGCIENSGAQVAVVEVGASPLEPYNGESAVALLRSSVVTSILCASDPYAARGLMDACALRPHLVSGPCTNTSAGVALLERLTGLKPVNILTEQGREQLKAELVSSRSIGSPPGPSSQVTRTS